MSREASKLIEEHAALDKIIRESEEPDVVEGAKQLKQEVEDKLRACNVHPMHPTQQ